MSSLPKYWANVRLCDLAARITKGTTPKTYGFSYTSEGVRFVKAESLDQLKILHSLCAHVGKDAHDTFRRSQLAPNDVLFTIAGTLGRVAVVSEQDVPANTNQAVAIIRLKNPAMAQFVARYLSGADVAAAGSRGTGLQNLNLQQVSAIRVPLPPLSEQSRIVAKLDNVFERSRSARKELARIPRLIQRYKQAILATAFAGDLTMDWRKARDISLEEDWSTATLGDLSVDVRYGTAAKCHYEPKDTPVLRIPNVVNGCIDTNDLKYGRFDKKEVEKLALRSGDLLVIRSNGSLDLVGRAALATDEVAGYLYAGYLIRLRLDSDRIYPAFAQWAFEEPEIRQRIENFAKSTSGVNNINSEQLKALRLPVPPLPEQREIVRRVESAFTRIDRTGAEAARATLLLDRLDQATLAKAFRGELSSPMNCRSDAVNSSSTRRRRATVVRETGGTPRARQSRTVLTS